MQLKLTLDLCKTLLEVYTKHDLANCTDHFLFNRHPDSAGWVACTRCWLLDIVQAHKIPKDVEFNVFATVKIPKRDVDTLLSEYVELLNTLGAEHPETENYFASNKNNKEFAELAILAFHIRKNHDDK